MKKWIAMILSILAVFALAVAVQAEGPDPEPEYFSLALRPEQEQREPNFLLWQPDYFEIHTNIVRNGTVLFYYDENVEPIWVWVNDDGYGEAWFTSGTTDVDPFKFDEVYNEGNLVQHYKAHIEYVDDNNVIATSDELEYTAGMLSADTPVYKPTVTNVTSGALRRDSLFSATVSHEPDYQTMCVVLFDEDGDFAVDSHWVDVYENAEPAVINVPLLKLEINKEYTAKIYGLIPGYPMAYAKDADGNELEYVIRVISPSAETEDTEILIGSLQDEYLTGELIMPTVYYPNSEGMENIQMEIAVYATRYENSHWRWDKDLLFFQPDEDGSFYYQPEVWDDPIYSWNDGEHVFRITVWQNDGDQSILLDSLERTFNVISHGPIDYDPGLPVSINAEELPYTITVQRPDAENYRVYGEVFDLYNDEYHAGFWYDDSGDEPMEIKVTSPSQRVYVGIQVEKHGYDLYERNAVIPVVRSNSRIDLWTEEGLADENADPLPVNSDFRLWVSAPGADWIRAEDMYGECFSTDGWNYIEDVIEFGSSIHEAGANPIIATAQFTDNEGNVTIESAVIVLQGFAEGEAGPFTASIDNDYVERGETVNVTYTKSENAEHYWVDVDCWNEDRQDWDYFIHLADLNVWGENNGGTAILDTMELEPGTYRLRAVAEGTGYYRAEHVITEEFNVIEADIPDSGILVNVTPDHVETIENIQVSAYAPGAEWLEVYWDYGNDNNRRDSDGGDSRSWNYSYGRSGTYQIMVKAGCTARDEDGNEIWDSDDDGNEWPVQDEWWSDPVEVFVTANNGSLTLTIPDLPVSLAPSDDAEISFTVEKPENAEVVVASVWFEGEDYDLFWNYAWEEELAVNVRTPLTAGQTVCISIHAQARGYECADFDVRIPVIDETSSDLVLLTVGRGDVTGEGTLSVPMHANVEFLVGAAEGHTLTAAKLYGPNGWWCGGEEIRHDNHEDWFDEQDRAFFQDNFDNEESIGRSVPVYALARIDDSEDWVQSEVLWFNVRDYEIGRYSFTGETEMTVERGKDAVFTFSAADGADNYWVDAWDIYQDRDSYQPDSVCNGMTVTMNTAQFPEGEYIVRGRAGADGKGWRESDNSVRLTVTASTVPVGEVQFTVNKTEAVTEEEICVSFFAPGADWVEIIRRYEDGREDDFGRNDREGTMGRFSECNSRTVEIFGRAHFYERDENGDIIELFDDEGYPYPKEFPWIESEISEITFRAPNGQIELDGSDIPVGATAGNALQLHVPYPADADYMSWNLYLNRNFDDDWQEPDYFGDNAPGDALDITIPGSEIIAGNIMELQVWAGATGYEHDHQNFTIRVTGAPEGRITLTVSEDEVLVNEDFTVTISVDEELGADYIQYNNGGNRFWSYWDDEGGYETDCLHLDENNQWVLRGENFGNTGSRALYARAWIPDENAEDRGYWIESNPVKVTVTKTGTVGDFSIALEDATVARGELVTLNYTVAEHSNEGRYDLHHDRNRRDDGEGNWIDYDLHWQRNEETNQITFSTAGMPAGEYRLTVWACGEQGYEGRESRNAWLTVTESNVPEGEISLTADRTEALTGEDVFVSMLAPGADWTEIIRVHDDGWEQTVAQSGGEGTANHFNENDPRTVRLFGRAHYFERNEDGEVITEENEWGNEEPKEREYRDSQVIEIAFAAPKGKIDQNAGNIPVSATAGEPLTLSMPYPEHASYMGWRLYLNRDYEDEDQRADYSGDGALELTVTGDRIVAGNPIELQVWVDGIGYEHNHQNYNILVTNGYEDGITLEVSENEVLVHENFTVTVTAPDAEFFQYFNGNVFWTDWDEDLQEHVNRNIELNENGQWVFEEQNYDETGVKALYARTCIDGEWVTSDPVRVTVKKLGTVGDFSVNLQEAAVTRGDIVTLNYTVADHSNENGYDLHHDRNRRNDDEWIHYDLNWQRDEENHRITFSTAEMPAGEYWLYVWAPGEQGYEGRDSRKVWLTVNEAEGNPVAFNVSKSAIVTNERVQASIYAPGAERLEIHWGNGDVWDNLFGDSWNGDYGYSETGTYQVFARVWYPDQQNPVDSDMITITVSSNGRKIPFDFSGVPARFVEGTGATIVVPKPEGSDYMGWEIWIDDEKYMDDSSSEDGSINKRIPGGRLHENGTVHLKAWTGAIGYDNNFQEFRIPVVGQAEGGITFTASNSVVTGENANCTARFPAGTYSRIQLFDGEGYGPDEEIGITDTEWHGTTSFWINGIYTLYARLWSVEDEVWVYTDNAEITVTAPNGQLMLDVSGVPARIYEGNDVTFSLGEVKNAAGNTVDFRPNYELFYDDDTERKDLITWDEDPENPKTGIITISQNDIVDGRVFRLNYNVFARGYEPAIGGMDIRACMEPTVTLSVDKKTVLYGEEVHFTVNAPGSTSSGIVRWENDQAGEAIEGSDWAANELGIFQFNATATFPGSDTIYMARPVSVTVRSLGEAPAPSVTMPESGDEGAQFDIHVTPAPGGWVTVRIYNSEGEEEPQYIEHSMTPRTLSVNDALAGTYRIQIEYGKDGYDNVQTVRTVQVNYYYGDPEWNWENDSSAAHATFTSLRSDDEQTREARITSEVTTEPTCSATGIRTYTATVTFNGRDYTDTRETILEMKEHIWNTPEFEWTKTEDGYSATATFTCGSCGDIRTEDADVTRIRHTDATCTKQEVSVYRAVCEGYSEDKTVYGDALGHDWGDWSVVWNDDDYTAYAIRECERCRVKENSEPLEVTHETTKEATCSARGEITYTVNATLDGETVYSTKKQFTPKTAHTPGEPAFSEDGHYIHTHCTVCGTILKTEEHNEHLWGEPEYEWAEDYSQVTATCTCTATAGMPHSVTETVNTVTEEVCPGNNTPGSKKFIAVFENPLFSRQEKEEVIPALQLMTTLQLPTGLTVIRSEAFAGLACHAVIIPEGCLRIEEDAFRGCKNLVYVEIPASTEFDREKAFKDCNRDLVIRIVNAN